MFYKNIELCNIPDGLGGTLPAAICDEKQVICLHPEQFNNWLLTVRKSDRKPFTYTLTDAMKKIIDGRLSR